MKKGEKMYIEIDFNSDEALYMQLRNQIILGIATHQYVEGDSLPSVRQLAEEIGINMHTVNKAYGVLKQEGLIRLDRRRGAVISLDLDKIKGTSDMKKIKDLKDRPLLLFVNDWSIRMVLDRNEGLELSEFGRS